MRLPSLVGIFALLIIISASPVSALDFSDILNTKGKELEQIYKSQLPQEVSTKVKNPQAGSSNTTSEDESVAGAAGGYAINRGAKTPVLENNPVTTDLGSFFANLLAGIDDLFSGGSKEARQYADSHFPVGVGEQAMKNSQTYNTNSSHEKNLAQNSRVLGLFDSDQSMGRSLEVVKCAFLPAGLCNNNLPVGSPLNAPIEPPIPPPQTVSYKDIPYYKTDTQKAEVIDGLVSGFIPVMESTIHPEIKKAFPTSLIDSWREVIAQSYIGGLEPSDPVHMWNPIFVLAIWLEETHASDACGLGKDVWGMGVIKLPPTKCSDSDFEKEIKFDTQLGEFLKIINTIPAPKTIDQFLCKYSEGKDIGPDESCTFTINPQFPINLPKVYYCLVKGTYPHDCESGGGGGGGSVDLLVTDIGKNCKDQVTNEDDGKTYVADGIVNTGNMSCLDSLNTNASAPYTNSVLAELKSFHDGKGAEFDNIQCVGFARAALLHATGQLLPKIDNAIDISSLTKDRFADYAFIAKNSSPPAVGDLAVWDTRIDTGLPGFRPSPDGHVGFIVELIGTTSFRIAEGNLGPRGKVRSDRIIPVSHPQIIGWLHKTQ